MCIDKDNFQHEQQRNDNHTRAELAQPAGTDLHHAVRDKAGAIPSVIEKLNGIITAVMNAGTASVRSLHFTRARLEVISTPTYISAPAAA